MIRSLIIAIFFFFGPAILMFAARNLLQMLPRWLERRRQEKTIIDVTPVDEHATPRWFYLLVLLVSLSSAVTIFITLQRHSTPPPRIYVPAHSDPSGNIIPGHWQSTSHTNEQADRGNHHE